MLVPTLRANTGREQMQQKTCVVARLFDHLVDTGEQRRRRVDAERLSSLQIDHQLVFNRRLHRQVSRLLPFEDAVDVAGRAAVLINEVGTV